MDEWGVYERRVESPAHTRKGARFPIRWTERVIREGWYFNCWAHVAHYPKGKLAWWAQRDDTPPESVTYEQIHIPTWIHRRQEFIENWIIASATDPEFCMKRTEVACAGVQSDE